MGQAKAKKALTTQERLSGAFTNAVSNHIDRKGTADEIVIAALGVITATLRAVGDQDAKEALAQIVVKHTSIATKGVEWWEAYSSAIKEAQGGERPADQMNGGTQH